MAQVQKTQAINQQEKRVSITYSMDQENEVSKIFSLSLRLIRCGGKERKLVWQAVQ